MERYWPVKRLAGLILSIEGLILSTPLMLVIWVVVKLTSPGPAIFTQQRLGKDGIPFTIYKFRTMWGSEKGKSVYQDARITWAGKLLRPCHFDELPQLWNVIKGDMSLVGPRPRSFEHSKEIVNYVPNFYDHLLVKPGITGLAQVSDRPYDMSKEGLQKSFNLDMEYIRTYSLLIDLKILFGTVVVVLERNGN
jgi:lipopolysaccharide/colanic/teichoic acid biosynthesis glycosyltransferase